MWLPEYVKFMPDQPVFGMFVKTSGQASSLLCYQFLMVDPVVLVVWFLNLNKCNINA